MLPSAHATSPGGSLHGATQPQASTRPQFRSQEYCEGGPSERDALNPMCAPRCKLSVAGTVTGCGLALALLHMQAITRGHHLGCHMISMLPNLGHASGLPPHLYTRLASPACYGHSTSGDNNYLQSMKGTNTEVIKLPSPFEDCPNKLASPAHRLEEPALGLLHMPMIVPLQSPALGESLPPDEPEAVPSAAEAVAARKASQGCAEPS